MSGTIVTRARKPRYATKNAARAAGLKTEREWMQRFSNADGFGRIPKRKAKPIVVKGEPFFRGDDCEQTISQTEAGRRGLKVKQGVKPVGTFVWSGGASWPGRRMEYDVYRLSDCVPKREATSKKENESE